MSSTPASEVGSHFADLPGGQGKTASQTDAYYRRFVHLTPNERVVEELEFETSDPALRGLMRMTTTLVDAGEGTDVIVLHEGLPSGISTEENEIGTRMALDKLAALCPHAQRHQAGFASGAAHPEP